MKVLLSFTGFHDPYFCGLVDNEEHPGPILSILSDRVYDHIFLFQTFSTQQITDTTKKAINELYPRSEVHILDTNLSDPTNYSNILKSLRNHVKNIKSKFEDPEFFIAVASGTPHMHACWVLLSASREISAHILQVRPKRFVTKDLPLVSEIDLSSKEFPKVRFEELNNVHNDEEVDFKTIVNELGIIGEHDSIVRSFEIGAMLGPADVPVLISGETGTGKELFAKYVHLMSGRPTDKFIVVNCAAIPENLVESILFGHKKGSFTGAVNDQVGKFDMADKGTLFLDELGELPMSTQVKLLRVLQDGFVEPVGEARGHKINVRIICATNRELKQSIKQGKFREDLYYRLNVGEIKLPPLRKRKSDIPKIALNILDRINKTIRKNRRLSTKALSKLQSFKWPGNVRDLQNVIERSVLLSKKEILDEEDLLIDETRLSSEKDIIPEFNNDFSLDGFLSDVRNKAILKALEEADGNQSKAGRLLGISPQAVNKFLKQNDQ